MNEVKEIEKSVPSTENDLGKSDTQDASDHRDGTQQQPSILCKKKY